MVESDEPLEITQRTGHIAVCYKNSILVWGGYKESVLDATTRYPPGKDLWVFDTLTEKWFQKTCRGNWPDGTSGATAVVVDKHLYIWGGYREDGNTNDIYRLDLVTLWWDLMETSGPPPIPSDKMVGWEHDDKLYFFGGFGIVPDFSVRRPIDFHFVLDYNTPDGYRRGWNNQFVSFNISTKEWTWPEYQGKAPVARAAHAVAKVGRKVFIFGGRHQQLRLNDIQYLDLHTMTWSGRLAIAGKCPQGRSWHSLTGIRDDTLLLYGGFSQHKEPLSDCWRFDVGNLTWTEVELPFKKPRLWHAACMTPFEEVIVTGGCSENILDHNLILHEHSCEVLFLRFCPKSLFRLCMDKISECALRLKEQCTSLPHNIQYLIKVRSSLALTQQDTTGGS